MGIEIVRGRYLSHSIGSECAKPCDPHLTIAKMSKNFKLRRKLRKIKVDHYVEHVDLEFGSQTIDGLFTIHS